MPYLPSKDPFKINDPRMDLVSAFEARAVVPSDTVDLTKYARAVFAGVGGDVCCIPIGNGDAEAVTFKNVQAGAVLPVRIRRVLATGTTATLILALY